VGRVSKLQNTIVSTSQGGKIANMSIVDRQDISQYPLSCASAALKEKAHLKLLIVDDDDQFLGLLKRRLQEEGFQNISLADNGEAGVAQAVRVKPDVIILDTILPPTDGFAVCKEIIRIQDWSPQKLLWSRTHSGTLTQRDREKSGQTFIRSSRKIFYALWKRWLKIELKK